jgi:hypothetical protein
MFSHRPVVDEAMAPITNERNHARGPGMLMVFSRGLATRDLAIAMSPSRFSRRAQKQPGATSLWKWDLTT